MRKPLLLFVFATAAFAQLTLQPAAITVQPNMTVFFEVNQKLVSPIWSLSLPLGTISQGAYHAPAQLPAAATVVTVKVVDFGRFVNFGFPTATATITLPAGSSPICTTCPPGQPGRDGKDGVGIAGRDGKDGKDGKDGSGSSRAFEVTLIDATHLAIGAACSFATPCTVQFGSHSMQFHSGAVATLVSGTGLVSASISPQGMFVVRRAEFSDVELSCSADCQVQNGPNWSPDPATDHVLLGDIQAAAGAFLPATLRDWRAVLSRAIFRPGFGIMCVEMPGTGITQCSADTTMLLYRLNVPPGPGPCVAPNGEAVDKAGFLYKCVQSGLDANGSGIYRLMRSAQPMVETW